jgi:CheY-like chemotaxis protein
VAPGKALRVLIVEDEALIAMSLEDLVQGEGCVVVGLAGSVQQALGMIAESENIEFALLDLNLRGQVAYPVADALTAKCIPFVITSGYGSPGIEARYAGHETLVKPIDPMLLKRKLAEAGAHARR